MNIWNTLPDNITETMAELRNLAGFTRGSIMYTFETIYNFVSKTDFFSSDIWIFFFFFLVSTVSTNNQDTEKPSTISLLHECRLKFAVAKYQNRLPSALIIYKSRWSYHLLVYSPHEICNTTAVCIKQMYKYTAIII